MTQPWLSVIVPVLNGARFLPRALTSIANEGDDRVEVIALDDGSTDTSLEILNRFSSLMNLTVIHRNAGNWVASSNHGLHLGRGTHACFLHQDDYWLPGRLVAVQDQLARTPGASLLLHACRFVDPAGKSLGPWRCPLPPNTPIPPDLCIERLLVQNFAGIPGAVFPRETAVNLGGLDESLWYTADWDLWMKLAFSGPVVYLPRPHAAFRIHPDSQTASRSRSLVDFRRQMEMIPERYGPRWRAKDARTRQAVERCSRAAIELNLFLAAAYHREPLLFRRLLTALSRLRPWDWHRMLRDSRLWERASARFRAGFSRHSCKKPDND